MPSWACCRHSTPFDVSVGLEMPLLLLLAIVALDPLGTPLRQDGYSIRPPASFHIARMDLALPQGMSPPVGAPQRVARLAWHRFTGR